MSGFQVTSRPPKQPSLVAVASNPAMSHYSTSPSSSINPALPSPVLRNARTSPDLRALDLQPRTPMIPNGSQVLVTLDADAAYFVDLSASTSPAAIKERIYAKLGIYDDDHLNCRISRCRAGQPIGQPLDDWQLWDMCMRAAQDSDPPMLIVLSSSTPTTTTTTNHHIHYPPPLTPSTHQQQAPYAPRRNSNLNHSPNSSDSHSHLKHDHSSSIGSRDSAGPSHHLSPRSRWQRMSRDHVHPPISPQPRDSSSSSSHRPSLVPTSSSADLRHPSPAPGFAPSPIAPTYPDDRRISPNSNLPFDSQLYSTSRRPSRPKIDPPDDWVRIQHPVKLSPESASSPISSHHRIPSDPSVRNSSSSAQALSDPRFPSEYSRPYRSAAPTSSKNPSSNGITRRFPQSSQSSSSNRRGDLQMAKSMEELHVKRIPANVTHPPLPNDSAIKIAASPASRAPPPLRIPRPSHSSRPSYPPQSTPNFPFPQPAINNTHMRPARSTGPPGYSSSGAVSSGGGAFRIDPRAAAAPPSRLPTSSVSNPRVSLQIPDNRHFDLARPPPRPRTGDGSSSGRPSQFADRQVPPPLAAQSHFQQAVSHSSIHFRPGDILQDTVSNVRRREQPREYRTELEREPAQRRPKNSSPTTAQSLSSRSARHDDEMEVLRLIPTGSLDRPIRRVNNEAGLQTTARSLPIDKNSAKQEGSTNSLDIPLEPSSLPANYMKETHGGFEGDLANHPTNQNSSLINRTELGSAKNQLSLTIPQGNTSANGRTERRLGNGTRYSDEGLVRDNKAEPFSPSDHAHSAVLEDGVNAELRRKFNRGRSATTTSVSTGTFASFDNSSTALTSATTPSSKFNMFEDCEEEDDDEAVGTFVTPMQPYTAQLKDHPSPIKPKLSLNTTPGIIPPLDLPKIDRDLSINETPISKSLSGSITLINPPTQGTESVSNGHLSVSSTSEPENKRSSKRISFTGDDWAVRPPVDEVYENLEDFFPHHDLDKPIDIGVIPPDLNSPSSPAATNPVIGSSATPISTTNNGNINNTPSATAVARLKGRTRSIRVVAQEKKKLLRRTEDRARAASQQNLEIQGLTSINNINNRSERLTASLLDHSRRGSSALLRRKSTKLWGVKIEELVPGAQVSIPSSIDESSTVSFKWVKGELIGKGSFGQVYLALNATNGEMLAVKQVELPKTRSDRECERQKSVVNALTSEIHLMRDLEHPNIVQYLGFEETNVYLSIFLEYVPGGSIARCLRRHGAFELNVIKYFTFQVLEGLKYLHSLHILHRDLKADNLLVDFSGNCKISDFGISKKSEHIYENNTQMSLQGSIFWMAPEVVHNPNKKGYSAKVDIWSLGCVVLEMFAGRRPWSDEEAIQAMFKLGAERLRPPVPPDVKLGRMSDHFLAQCFIVDPDQRPTADRLTDHRFLEIDDANWRFEDSELYRSIRMPH